MDKIIIHCSATPSNMDIGAQEIRRWHVEDNGWSDIGYHFVIRRDGELEYGRDINRDGAHTKGYNKGSIGVCLIGGVDASGEPVANFTKQQWRTLRLYLKICKALHNGVTIHGHNGFAAKACPSFNVQEWLRENKI